MITLWPEMVSSWKPLSPPSSSCSLVKAGVEMRCTMPVAKSRMGTISSATSVNCQLMMQHDDDDHHHLEDGPDHRRHRALVEERDGLGVVGDAAHQLAQRLAVEEAEREGLHVVEEMALQLVEPGGGQLGEDALGIPAHAHEDGRGQQRHEQQRAYLVKACRRPM